MLHKSNIRQAGIALQYLLVFFKDINDEHQLFDAFSIIWFENKMKYYRAYG